jgi:NADH:ubiquinone oxidoreductase subunit 2 (subunit N)
VYYYLRLVVVMYMQPAPLAARNAAGPAAPRAGELAPGAAAREPEEGAAWASRWVIGAAAAGVLLIGLFPDNLLQQSIRSVQALLERR